MARNRQSLADFLSAIPPSARFQASPKTGAIHGICAAARPLVSVDVHPNPCQKYGLKNGSHRVTTMATDRLTVRAIIALRSRAKVYIVPDGRGLYLKVQPGGARSWLLRYQMAGKVHDLGLGSYPEVSLADARGRALEARR